MRLDEDDFVHEQYRSTAKLKTRSSVWHPDAQGRWPQDVALSALAWVKPRRLLEVGSGTGAFAASCSRELSCQVVALDSSAAMVAATGAAGVEALLGDVQDLPFPDGTFDAAVAAWMLYHVADRDLAISELARVLRPGGRLVAITNGIGHLAELWELIGAVKSVVSSTLEQVDWNAVLVRGDLGKDVQQLKRESGKGLLVGRVKLSLALTELGLIDEYEFVLHPRLAGHGPTLFAGLSKHVDLKLVSRLEFGSGAVAMRYEPRH
ncbi:MAG TPA: methyltransferase domain-containing protein [Candidatus Dormibacteraeota bacterium]|nr:methyltransferase domain-containing protein [Candidatus Dormibacteraeota bacterium]